MEPIVVKRRLFGEQVSDVIQQDVRAIGCSGWVNLGDGSDVAPIAMIRGGRKGNDTRVLFGHKQTRRARQQVVMLGSTVSHQANLPPPIDCSEQDTRSLRVLLVTG